MYIFHFLALMYCASSDLETIRSAIKLLHENTTYGTFYELFGCAEYTSLETIQRKFRGYLSPKAVLPKTELSPEKFRELVTKGFDILKRNRKEYNAILNNAYFMYDDSKNYKTSKFMVFVSLIALLLCLDLMYFCVKFINYCKIDDKREDAEPVKTKKGKKISIQRKVKAFPVLMVVSAYKKAVSLFSK